MKLRNSIFLSVIAFAGLASCTSKQAVVEKTKIEKTATVNKILVPYFKAIGTEPFWGIEISEKEVKFTELGNEKGIIFPNENLQIFEEDKKMTFSTKTHMLILQAMPGGCDDGMSDLVYSHKVVATLIDEMTGEATENYGCGEFFADPELSNVWTLKTFRDQNVDTKDFGDQTPILEFVTEKNMFTGFAGCNTINGKLVPNSKDRIKLTNIASTKMMCGPGNREQEFIGALSKVGAYKFDGDTLILLDATYVPIATFTKR